MERMASSKYRDFIERGLASDLLGGDRHIGIAVATGGEDVWGLMGKPNWSFKTGLYSTSWQDGNPFGQSVTTNAAGAVTAVNFGYLPAIQAF